MATTDPNGLVLVDGSDSMQPLHPVLNSITQSVSNAFNENTRIYPVASLAARTALFNRIGATSARPLFVWYSPGATGRQLMYTRGGNATADWKFYSSSEDTAESRIWRVANVTGRTTIFNSVGPGTTANPVMVWRADAPVGQQLEYNVTNSNVVANWHYVKTSQDVLEVASGTAVIPAQSIAANSNGLVHSITFPFTFSGVPKINVSHVGANYSVNYSIWSKTATGFGVAPRNIGISAFPSTFTFQLDWHAIFTG